MGSFAVTEKAHQLVRVGFEAADPIPPFRPLAFQPGSPTPEQGHALLLPVWGRQGTPFSSSPTASCKVNNSRWRSNSMTRITAMPPRTAIHRPPLFVLLHSAFCLILWPSSREMMQQGIQKGMSSSGGLSGGVAGGVGSGVWGVSSSGGSGGGGFSARKA